MKRLLVRIAALVTVVSLGLFAIAQAQRGSEDSLALDSDSDVSVPEVVLGEPVAFGVFAGEHALVEDNAHDHARARLLGNRQDLGGRLLLEEIVDYLDHVEVATPHQVDDAILVLLGRGDADGSHLAFFLEAAEDLQWYRVAVPSPGPGVEQEHIEAVRPEVLEPLVDIFAEVVLGIPLLGRAIG